MTDRDQGRTAAPDQLQLPTPTPTPFVWRDHGRFVEVHPVERGWLVLWGRHEDAGRRTVLAGNRTYPELAGARARLAAAVPDLLGRPESARRPDVLRDALLEFDRFPFPAHRPAKLPDPL